MSSGSSGTGGGPPRLPRWLLSRTIGGSRSGQYILGDLHEEWHQRTRESQWRAAAWYWITAVSFVFGGWMQRLRPRAGMLHGITQDLGLGVRNLARRPLFTLLGAGSLAIGIGSTTAIYSVAERLLLRPLDGVEQPEHVVEIGSTFEGNGFDTFSYPEVRSLATLEAFDQVAAWTQGEMSHAREDARGGAPLSAFWVSAEYFSVLGVRAVQGRLFTPSEHSGAGAHPVVVVSHGFWRRVLGADPSAVGRTLRLDRQPYTVVGVTSEDFRSHVIGLEADVWVPITQSREFGAADNWGSNWAFALARLSDGTSTAQADASVREHFRRIEEVRPDTHGHRGARVLALGPVPGGGRAAVQGFLGALIGLVSLVMLVTCANVAGMMLSRGVARSREVAVRAALGASRARLVRYLGTEALLLFALGAIAGVVFAHVGLSRIDLTSLPLPTPVRIDLTPNAAVMALSLLLSAVAGLLFGVMPAMRMARPQLTPALKATDNIKGGRGVLLRRAFVSGQIALSLVLVCAAALFHRSLTEVERTAVGFDPAGVHLTTLDLSREGYVTPAQRETFHGLLLEEVSALPGATGAALSSDLPLDLATSGTSAVVDGLDPSNPSNRTDVHLNSVSPDYFRVLDIRLLAGRAFDETDRLGTAGVAMVSRAFSERVWPGTDPLGRTVVLLSGDDRPLTVVGVADDVKNAMITDEPSPLVYTPFAQRGGDRALLTVGLSGTPVAAKTMIAEAVRRADPLVAITRVVSLTEYTGVGTLPQRLAARVAASLALVALLLSGLGIYGIIALSVLQRTREIGVRKALGASNRSIGIVVLGWALWLSVPGLALGALLILLLVPLLGSLLVGVSPTDPVAILGVTVLFGAVVLLAALFPARAALRVEAMEALRCE